jgi:uncharacterized protein YgiM (DUF1202 family)
MKAFTVSDIHWEVLVTFMENHSDLAIGRLNVPSARDTHKKITGKVNYGTMGRGERKTDKWQKYVVEINSRAIMYLPTTL